MTNYEAVKELKSVCNSRCSTRRKCLEYRCALYLALQQLELAQPVMAKVETYEPTREVWWWCPRCEEELDEQYRICPNCGQHLAWNEEVDYGE